MKRAVSLLLSAALLLGLTAACQRLDSPAASPSGASVRDWPALQLDTAAVNASGWGFPAEPKLELYYVDGADGQEWLEAYIENAYGIQDPWLDAAVERAAGTSAFEVAVLRMEDADSAVRAAEALESYRNTRQGDFAGYAPEEADMAASGRVMQMGAYAALFICPDPSGAWEALEDMLRGDYVEAIATLPPDSVTDVKDLRDILVADQGMNGAALELLDSGNPEALRAYIKNAYGLEPDQWDECAIARDEATAFEIAAFRFSGESGENDVLQDGEYEVPVFGGSGGSWERASAVERALNDYLSAREAQFDSSSSQAKLLHRAVTIDAGDYLVMLACEDWSEAADAFTKATGIMGYGYSPRYRYLDTDPNFPDRCAFTAPNHDDMSLYDTSAILAAWEKGDPSGLPKEDREIYDAAQKVLEKVLKEGMSDYDKEAAVYNWMVNNVNYDWTHQDRMQETPRASFGPYGGLVNRTAVCLGYAATFQLLMDMAGVECIIVRGASFSSQEDHGWNMVRLNGQWYCVDVTWDANRREYGGSGKQKEWSYFNVTSDYMADSDHQWDYANTPEATADDHGQG